MSHMRSAGALPSGPLVTPAFFRQVERGLSFSTLELLRRAIDLSLDKIAGQVGISRATLHRRKKEKRLTPAESEKVLRYARLFDQARRVFGDAASARLWLKFPQQALGQVAPLDYARTELGAREVEDLLGRIDHGVYS